MKRSANLKLLWGAAASLLPLLAPGESRVTSEQPAASERASATAHVLFKIVIPEVLAMDFGDAQPHRIQLIAVGHRAIARLQSCTPIEAAPASRGMSCTLSTP